MRKLGLLAILILGWGAWAQSQDCKPRDFYTRSVKIYLKPSQGKPDVKKAEQLLAEAMKCYPEDGEVLYTAGMLFGMKKEYSKMTEVLNSAIKFSPDYGPKAETLKAYVFQETFSTGNTYLDRAQKAEKEPEKAKHLREAMAHYQGCIIIDSTASGPYKNISVAYYMLGRPDSSTLYDGIAFKIAPDSARWAYSYAVGLVNQQSGQENPQYKEAVNVLEKVVKLDSTHWDAWGLLGQLYEVENRLPEMVSAYRRLSAQFPDSADFLKQLAIYELRSGLNSKAPAEAKKHYQEADTLFSRYLSKNPADSAAWYNHGLALLSLKNFAKAAKVLEKATEKFPGYADVWEGLSGAYAQMGNKGEEAKKAFERSKKLRGETGGK